MKISGWSKGCKIAHNTRLSRRLLPPLLFYAIELTWAIKMRARLLDYLLTMALLCTATAHAEVFEQTLGNGLRVIVKEDHRAPVVVQQVWYRAGSMD